MVIQELDGAARISISCQKSVGWAIRIAGHHRPPVVRPPMLSRGAENRPIVTYAVDGRGPFEEEWVRTDDGVNTKDAAQARFFLSQLRGSRFLFVSVDGWQSFEFDLHRQSSSPWSSPMDCHG
jgi:hypothetical protein